MSVPIPIVEPPFINAGDTLKFTKAFNDYAPADGWTLSYSLSALNRQRIDLVATTSGTDFLINYNAGATIQWQAGWYLMVGWVTNGTDRAEIFRKDIEIRPDVATTDAVDSRPFAQRALEKLEAAMLDQSGRLEISYSINGRSVTFQSREEATKYRNELRSEIAQQRRKKNGSTILTRFGKAR